MMITPSKEVTDCKGSRGNFSGAGIGELDLGGGYMAVSTRKDRHTEHRGCERLMCSTVQMRCQVFKQKKEKDLDLEQGSS